MSTGARSWVAKLCFACATLSPAAHAQVPTRTFPPVPSTPPNAPPNAPPPPAPTPTPGWVPVPLTRDERFATEATPTSFSERPWLLEGVLGGGTPYGLLGGALAYDFIPELGAAVGAGIGAYGATTALALRFRYPFRRIGLGAELAWSGGPYDYGECVGYCHDIRETYRHYDFEHWANAALVFEYRASGGFNLRVFGGIATPMNPEGSGECRGENASCGSVSALPMFGIALGGALSRE